MTTLSMKTMFAALLAGSLAVTAGGTAFARGDGAGMDPAKFQQRIEKRADKALNGTDATQDQKKIADDSSRRFTKALTDAANVLSPTQRQAFFKVWNERGHGARKG